MLSASEAAVGEGVIGCRGRDIDIVLDKCRRSAGAEVGEWGVCGGQWPYSGHKAAITGADEITIKS